VRQHICACSGVFEGLFVCTLFLFLFAFRPTDCTEFNSNTMLPMCATICCVQLMCAFERRQPAKLSVSFRLFAYVLIIVCV